MIGSWNVRMLLPLVGVTLALVATLLSASAVPSVASEPPSPPIWKVPTPNPMSHDYVGVPASDLPVVITDKDGKVLLRVTQQYFHQHLPEIEKQLNMYLGSGKPPFPPHIPPTPIAGASPTPLPAIGPPTLRNGT